MTKLPSSPRSAAAIIFTIVLGLFSIALPAVAQTTIGGRIVDDVSNQGIPGATVTFTLVSGTGPAPAPQTTDANGDYSYTTFNPGTYSISASATDYNTLSWPGVFDSSVGGVVTTVTVPPGKSNVWIYLHHSTSASVSGSVVSAAAGNAPIAGAVVKGVPTVGGANWSASTDVAGAYASTVVAGTYDITAKAWGYLTGSLTGVALATGSNTVPTFQLVPVATVTLSGMVSSGGVGIPGASVTIHSSLTGDSAGHTYQVTTDANGDWTLTVPQGSSNIINVTASGYIDPTPQTVVANATTTGIDFSLTPVIPPPARIRGHIVACDGTSITPPDIAGKVFAVPMDASGLVDPSLTPIETPFDSANAYEFSPLAAGRYALWAVPTNHTTYSPNYYSTISTPTSCTITDWHDATILTVAANQQVNNINIPVEMIASSNGGPSWTIFGTVVVLAPSMGASEVPLDSCGVFVRDSTGKLLKYAITDVAGAFNINGLPKGVYHLSVDHIGYNVLVRDSIARCTSTDTPSVSKSFKMVTQDVSAVSDPSGTLPSAPNLIENFPNPFAGATTFSFFTDRSRSALLDVRDVLGRIVATVLNGPLTQGAHTAEFNATGLPAGLYFARLALDRETVVRPIMITR